MFQVRTFLSVIASNVLDPNHLVHNSPTSCIRLPSFFLFLLFFIILVKKKEKKKCHSAYQLEKRVEDNKIEIEATLICSSSPFSFER